MLLHVRLSLVTRRVSFIIALCKNFSSPEYIWSRYKSPLGGVSGVRRVLGVRTVTLSRPAPRIVSKVTGLGDLWQSCGQQPGDRHLSSTLHDHRFHPHPQPPPKTSSNRPSAARSPVYWGLKIVVIKNAPLASFGASSFHFSSFWGLTVCWEGALCAVLSALCCETSGADSVK